MISLEKGELEVFVEQPAVIGAKKTTPTAGSQD